MRKLILLLGSLCFLFAAQAQIQDHTQESYSLASKEAKVGEEIDVIFRITIDKDWYIYGSEFEAEGPYPSSFDFEAHDSYQLVGKVQQINPKKKYDDIWEGNVTYFEKKAEFRQKIKILKKDLTIQGSFVFQTCSNVTGQCLPPETVEFSFGAKDIQVSEAPVAQPEEKENDQPQAEEPPQEEDEMKQEDQAQVVEADSSEEEVVSEIEEAQNDKPEEAASDEEAIIADTELAERPEDSSLLGFMLIAFLTGFLALLTPCVFPMIPMTVTFFLKQSESRKEGVQKAIVYGLSIMVIYTLIGTVFSFIFGATSANALSTHWLPNIFFFLLLVVFGLSFLGMFEIVLPSSWVNRADRQADQGGYIGIFFMAFVLALVSFSCTFPIAGSILVLASQGVWFKATMGMLAYSLAVALPFTLFAIFPAWLNSLPKSGGWLNSVKVVLGFLELALALKFLSVADQVYHWGILDRDVFLALWIVIFGMMGFYLLGKIRMPHDSPMERVSVPRLMLAILSLSFVVYMIPGLFGAPLKPLAGYLPPITTLEPVFANQQVVAVESESADLPTIKHAEFLKLPHNLQGFFDYKQGLAYAKKVNKPIFIDFTGHGCVNCREMEARVWSDPMVLKRLQKDFVVIALYVDDRTKLPEEEWYTSDFDQKVKKTIGTQNADFQIRKFNRNAQPYYVLLDHDGKLLATPREYNLNVEAFSKFLDQGSAEFDKRSEILANR